MRIAHPHRAPYAIVADAPLLELSDVAVAYGGIEAVKGISLHVRTGEIVALIGANGAGKTTTLKTIVRLLPCKRGRMRFAGLDLAEHDAEEVVARGISLVPEGRAIFPNLTVRENLELGGYHHQHLPSIRESVEDVVSLFPRLGERMSQLGGTLSGGEQQMLAIGRALVSRPALLLLDEPSLGIAPRLVQDIFVAIRKVSEAGMTILLVEQNTRLALRTSSRAYVLKAGLVVKEGASSELAEDPEIRSAYLGG